MGVAGCGKTTIGENLSDRIGGTFLDGDAFHPQANIEKMSQGIALTDEDALVLGRRRHVQPEIGLAFGRIGPVAAVTMLGKNWPDVTAEHRRLRRDRVGDHQDQ